MSGVGAFRLYTVFPRRRSQQRRTKSDASLASGCINFYEPFFRCAPLPLLRLRCAHSDLYFSCIYSFTLPAAPSRSSAVVKEKKNHIEILLPTSSQAQAEDLL
jgi:hypothetical protein